MTQLSIPHDIANGTPADGLELDKNFEEIQQYVNTELLQRNGTPAMTGPLTLVADPTQKMQAATKGYVDAATEAKKYAVAKTGDEMTGNLTMKNGARVKIDAEDTEYAIVEFIRHTGTTTQVATRYGYIGAMPKQPTTTGERVILNLENGATFVINGGDIQLLAAQGDENNSLVKLSKLNTELAKYLAEAGGTVTGDLTVNGSIFAKKQIAITDAPTANTHAATKKYVDDSHAFIGHRRTRASTTYTSTASDIDHIISPNVAGYNEGDITISGGTWTVHTPGVYAATLLLSSTGGFQAGCSTFISMTRGSLRTQLPTGSSNYVGATLTHRLYAGDDVTWGIRVPASQSEVVASTIAELNLLTRT